MLYKGLLGRAKTPSVRPMRSKHTCAVNWVKGKWPRPCARHPLRSSQTHTLILSLAHVTTWALSSLSQATKGLHLCSLRTPCEAATKQSQACTAFADMHVKKPAYMQRRDVDRATSSSQSGAHNSHAMPRVLWPNKGTANALQ